MAKKEKSVFVVQTAMGEILGVFESKVKANRFILNIKGNDKVNSDKEMMIIEYGVGK